MEIHGESSHDNVRGGEHGDGHTDDTRDLIVDGEKEIDEAGEEKEDCRVHHE
jgi:hypothetical protein